MNDLDYGIRKSKMVKSVCFFFFYTNFAFHGNLMVEIMKIRELYYSNEESHKISYTPITSTETITPFRRQSLQKLKSMTVETLANSLASIVNSKCLVSGSNTVIERLGLCFWPDQSTEGERLIPSFHRTYHFHCYESQT
ncbi:hypothetical protein VIGAN_03114900 [Vigna angularis var. angularis]|uniref:Uncharacterized protein n=1 Tax=Vigna angularis var. angularis TaxID=157739 RepID=A0A0S3RLF6_PHAAN|nr:hypothetical protein VIGAN_03114900 [Vigna angularis var. angularis]